MRFIKIILAILREYAEFERDLELLAKLLPYENMIAAYELAMRPQSRFEKAVFAAENYEIKRGHYDFY